MNKWIVIIVILFLLTQPLFIFSVSAENIAFMLIDLFIKDRIERVEETGSFIVGEKSIAVSSLLVQFYRQREYQPFWSDEQGPLPRAAGMIKIMRESAKLGLVPDHYQLDEIREVLKQIYDNPDSFKEQLNNIMDLDLLLTNAYFNFSSDLVTGYIDPGSIGLEGYAPEDEVDLITILEESSADEFSKLIQVLLPYQNYYLKMSEALNRYLSLAELGGWQPVPEQITLKRGDYQEEVNLVRRRLICSGDLAESETNFNLFDSQLEEAVKRFQYRHGLTVSGIVNQETIIAMNVPVEDRIEQLFLNMERLRWLPQNLGRRYLIVNIPDYRLSVVEDNKIKLEMKVIVGRRDRQTPAFASKLTGIVINPYWVVPQRIFLKDILPEIKQDISYLDKKNIKVFEDWRSNAKILDPETIDWNSITGGNYQFKLRQEPGPTNSLGQLKFLMPNKYTVYLHDTPARELFKAEERAFSSGCIRLEKPLELAAYLLSDNNQWSYNRIVEVVNSGEQMQINISEIPLYLVYWTSWVDEQGQVHFRGDPYQRDRLLKEKIKNNDVK